jgi:hypothetical protein
MTKQSRAKRIALRCMPSRYEAVRSAADKNLHVIFRVDEFEDLPQRIRALDAPHAAEPGRSIVVGSHPLRALHDARGAALDGSVAAPKAAA